MPQNLAWYFSEHPHGSDRGYHDAGIETFREDSFGYIARETIQNSLDARKNQRNPVEVRFELIDLPTAKIPDIASLRDAFKRSKHYWSNDLKAGKYFRKAEQLLRKKKIHVLKISDHNTTGLQGSDDKRGSNWHSLIRCFGASSKSAGEGGSFGIGSSAAFAASQLRTVFYSTVTGQSKSAFIGVTRLTTHENAKGVKVDPNGFLGLKDGKMVTNSKEIPQPFRRQGTGTTLFIMGLFADENWETEFKLSIVENFWPAIHFGKLTVTIGKTTIEGKNLERFLQWAADEHRSHAVEFWRCLNGGDVIHLSENLKHLQDVELHLRTAEGKLPKRVAMIRKPGMVVYQKRFQSPMPYCGVFRCENEAGNKRLRDMEPPRHDSWKGDLPEKGENKKVEIEFNQFIRDNIRALSNIDENETLDIPNLGRFLPDRIDSENGSNEPEFEGDSIPEDAEIPTAPIGSKPPRSTSKELGDLGPMTDSGDESENEHGENDGNNAGNGTGDGDGGHQQIEVPIESRAFAQDKGGKRYSLVLRPSDKQNHEVELTVRIVGEDSTDPVEIDSVTKDGKPVSFTHPGTITAVKLSTKKSTNLELTLAEPRRVSLEVTAYEN